MTSGSADKAKGRIEKAAGDLADDDRLRNRGAVDEAAGKVKEGMAKSVDAVKDTMAGRKDKK